MSQILCRIMVVTCLLVTHASGTAANSQDRVTKNEYKSASPGGTTAFPFEWYRGHILLKVDVNGTELRLTLDNGVLWDSLLLYGGPRIDGLGLKYDGKGRLGVDGGAASTTTDTASGITIRLGDIELKNQSAVVTPASSSMSKMFRGEDGVISGSLFKHFVVQIDFDRKVITLIEPSRFEYKGEGQAMPLTPFGRGAYTLPCTLHMQDGSSTVVNPVLDLGGLQPLLLFLGKRNDVSVPKDAIPAQLAVTWTGFIGRVQRLQIGKYSLENVITGFTEDEGRLGKDCEGLLGPPIFERFTVTFDYGNKTVFLEPNAHFHDEFKSPRVGLRPKEKGD